MNEDYRALMARREPGHWWAIGMLHIVAALTGPTGGRVLDVGCGTGRQLGELRGATLRIGVDVALPVPGVEAPDGVQLIRAEASRLPFVDSDFDLALALDLLEQRGVEASRALAEVRRVLKPEGHLLIRVPAHPWLYGPHDRFWGGQRRFRRAELRSLVERSGFDVERLSYAGSLIFPIAAVIRLLARAGWGGGDDMPPLPAPLNGVLASSLQVEARWLRRRNLPWGLSLLCLARR